MILGALAAAGGEKYLTKQAKDNPGPFMTLLGKVLPTQIGGDPNGVPISLSIVQQREAARREIAEAFAERTRGEENEADGETV
jgi:hypothetical protein